MYDVHACQTAAGLSAEALSIQRGVSVSVRSGSYLAATISDRLRNFCVRFV